MIQKLADLQPVILFGMLVLMYSLENVFPYLAKPVNKKKHDIQNLILTLIAILFNAAVGMGVVTALQYSISHHIGILYLLPLPVWLSVILGMLLMDLGSYGFHNLQHKWPLLWRFHRVHHSDLALNTTSSLRFHPVEVVLTQGLYFSVAVMVFGVSMVSFTIYGTIALIFVIMQHSNIRLPNFIERYARYIFSTPGWHKIHHSNEQKYTDSHYGDVFTFWDRIFGTWHRISPDEIEYGLKEFNEPKKQTAGYLLKSPFIQKTK